MNAADDEAVYAFSERAVAKIKAETELLGLFHPFIYLNNAAKTQKPFRSVGRGTVRKLKKVQDKYDPSCFLQNYLASGFKIE